MKTVFKYPIPIGNIVTIKMPKGAEILHVAEQNGSPCMWALVEPEAPMIDREFRFAGTGHPIKDEEIGFFCGTFFLREGALVFHIFETMRSLKHNHT